MTAIGYVAARHTTVILLEGVLNKSSAVIRLLDETSSVPRDKECLRTTGIFQVSPLSSLASCRHGVYNHAADDEEAEGARQAACDWAHGDRHEQS